MRIDLTTRLCVNDAKTVDVCAKDRWNATGLYLAAGYYRLTAAGEWLDSRICCGAAGANDGTFQLGKLAHIVGTGVGLVERGWQWLDGEREHRLQVHAATRTLALVFANRRRCQCEASIG